MEFAQLSPAERARQDQMLQDHADRERVRLEREAEVDRVSTAIQQGVTTEDSYEKMSWEASVLVRIVEQVILNARRGRSSRHQYADGHGSLAGVSMSLDDVDAALAVIRRIRGL